MLHTAAVCPITKRLIKLRRSFIIRTAPDIITVIKTRRIGWAEHVAWMTRLKKLYKNALPIASKDTRPNARPGPRRDNTALRTQLAPQRLPP
jgi:hypothetical protein